MSLKIYTKTGDSGETSLIGGRRVPKYHEQIEAYGTVDELNSYIGLVRDYSTDEHSREALTEIQERLFTIESLLAADPEVPGKVKLPYILEEDISLLEKEIDEMNRDLPGIQLFVLPGGHPCSSMAHVARTVCRRAERVVLRLSRDHPVDPICIKYLNRLSDYLFVLSRKINKDNNISEITWKPRV